MSDSLKETMLAEVRRVLWGVYGGFLNPNGLIFKLFRVNRAHFKSLLGKNFILFLCFCTRERTILLREISTNTTYPPLFFEKLEMSARV